MNQIKGFEKYFAKHNPNWQRFHRLFKENYPENIDAAINLFISGLHQVTLNNLQMKHLFEDGKAVNRLIYLLDDDDVPGIAKYRAKLKQINEQFNAASFRDRPAIQQEKIEFESNASSQELIEQILEWVAKQINDQINDIKQKKKFEIFDYDPETKKIMNMVFIIQLKENPYGIVFNHRYDIVTIFPFTNTSPQRENYSKLRKIFKKLKNNLKYDNYQKRFI